MVMGNNKSVLTTKYADDGSLAISIAIRMRRYNTGCIAR